MGKVKEFLKEHKRELVIGAVSTVLGATMCTAFKNKIYSEDKALIDVLRRYGKDRTDGSRLITNVIAAIGDSNFAEVHKFGCSDYGPITVRELGDSVTRYYEHKGIDLDTVVNGLILFEDRDL